MSAPIQVGNMLPSTETKRVSNATKKAADVIDLDHLEMINSHKDELNNLVYTNEDEEPEIHFRTYLALGSVCILLAGQGLAFNGPPTVQSWIPNALALVQAVLGPIISNASDVFQVRKHFMVASCALALIGSAIAPGSSNLYRVIGAQILIGVGLAAVPLSYVVPSEILPRRWRPMAQAIAGICAALMAVVGPLAIGALTKRDAHLGWRQYYWIQTAVWGAASLGILFGYRPPKRHTRLDHLSFWQKLRHLDIPGLALLTVGLSLFVFGLSVGGGVYPWKSATTLSSLIIGFVFLVAFGVYEWKGTTTGILNHNLFKGGKNQGRIFALCNGLIAIEGLLAFTFVVFYSIVSTALFTSDSFLASLRLLSYNGFFLISCPIWGWISTKFRTVREPLFAGYALFTVGVIGMATIQPGQSAKQLVFAALSGIGFGSQLILIIAAIQLVTPYHLIATATAVTNSSRAVGALVFTAGYSSALSNGLISKIPAYVAKAAGKAGLPSSSVPAFVGALAGNKPGALASIPGVTPSIIASGVLALQHAYADSLRLIYIIAAPLGLLGCIMCLFLGDLSKTMTYRVDAPLEDLHARHHHDEKLAS